MKSSKWVNSAARRRNQAKYRRVLLPPARLPDR